MGDPTPRFRPRTIPPSLVRRTRAMLATERRLLEPVTPRPPVLATGPSTRTVSDADGRLARYAPDPPGLPYT